MIAAAPGLGDWIVFWVVAPISVLSGVAMILSRNAVHAALWLIVNFFTLAVFFLILGSPFLFVVQIIVYAGAIMVLFLFVIMLLGVDQQVPLTERIKGQRWLAGLLGIGLVLEVFFAVRLGLGLHRKPLPDFAAVNRGGNVQALAHVLFNQYFFPFEVTSVLLIVAAIGAMLHGTRRIVTDEPPALLAPVMGGDGPAAIELRDGPTDPAAIELRGGPAKRRESDDQPIGPSGAGRTRQLDQPPATGGTG